MYILQNFYHSLQLRKSNENLDWTLHLNFNGNEAFKFKCILNKEWTIDSNDGKDLLVEEI